MGEVKALLVGVSDYSTMGCLSLPLCKNDIYSLRKAIINGLNVKHESIFLCGETGKVTAEHFFEGLKEISNQVGNGDTFIFYFSGHGAKDYLILSDFCLKLQDLIDKLEKLNAKNKIVILDSCHSGKFFINDNLELEKELDINRFVGYGYAVMSSCNSEETSGFNSERNISIYTGFLCDALMSRFLIKKSKKSLEEINEAIFHFADLYNEKNKDTKQHPIFRTNIGGTIFFEVEDYVPYKASQIFIETASYIIYNVEAVHHLNIKRLVVKVILRFHSLIEEVAKIAIEIKDKLLYSDVYKNKESEMKYTGRAANIVWCYFGYDEEDVNEGNYIFRSTWVDENQDRNHWYRKTNNSTIIFDLKIEKFGSYELNKEIKNSNLDMHKQIQLIRTATSKLIYNAEKYIAFFREYLNNTLTEDQFIKLVVPLNSSISKIFFEQSDFPKPGYDIYNWAFANSDLALTIYELTLFYKNKNLKIWDKEGRILQFSKTIKKYESDLEKLKKEEKILKNQIKD